MTFIIDFIYVCDILRSFRTTYYSKVTGEEIFNLRHIAKNYLRHGMLLDIIATLSVIPNLLPMLFKHKGVVWQLFNICAYLKI